MTKATTNTPRTAMFRKIAALLVGGLIGLLLHALTGWLRF